MRRPVRPDPRTSPVRLMAARRVPRGLLWAVRPGLRAPARPGLMRRDPAAADPVLRAPAVPAVPAASAEAASAEVPAAAEAAAARGLRIAFEYHPGTLTDACDSAVRLMREINHPAAGLYWQPDFRKSEYELLRGLEAALPWLRAIHLFSWLPDGTRLPLADRRPLWESLLRHVPQCDRIRLLLEFVPGDDADPAILAREAQTLRGIADQAGR